jgi:hypothetical protein
MRIGIITLLVTVHVSFTRPALCQDEPSRPLSAALRFSSKPPPMISTRRFADWKGDDQRPRGSVAVQFRTRSKRVTEARGTTSPNRNR